MAGEEKAQNSRGRGRGCYLRPGTRGARRLPGADGGLGRKDPVGVLTNGPSLEGRPGGGAHLLKPPQRSPSWIPCLSPGRCRHGDGGVAYSLSHRPLRPLCSVPPTGWWVLPATQAKQVGGSNEGLGPGVVGVKDACVWETRGPRNYHPLLARQAGAGRCTCWPLRGMVLAQICGVLSQGGGGGD